MKNRKGVLLVLIILVSSIGFAQTYYLQSFPAAPYPFDPYDGMESISVLDASNHIYLVEDSAEDHEMLQGLNRMSALDAPFPDGDGGTNGYYFESFEYEVPTNGLWLEITNVANGLAYFNLHNATNYVYEIYSKTDLAATNWNIEQELWPTDTNSMPFIVSQLERTNLFIWAQDWTGITSGGNTTPEWWFYYFYGRVDLLDTNRDGNGFHTLLYDYQHALDPNAIQFSLQFTNNSFSTNVVHGTITIVGGIPYYEAVLINDTNTANAVWQPYSSTNVTVNLPASNGTYQVEVGLKGLPPDAAQKWQTASLTCFKPDIIPLNLVITNPVASTVSVPMIQLQGLVSKALSTLTFDVSNAAGIYTNQPGYWQPAFYNTNLLAFTTNTFQCYDIRLTNGLNRITLHATDVSGHTATTNVSYTLDYSGDHTAPVLSIIWPTNGTVIAGSNFTMQAKVDDTTANATATITTNAVAGVIERNGALWFNNLPMDSGTNNVTITVMDAAGNMSTTNINVIQSAVSFTIDPLGDDQLNRTNVTVTGTIGDSSEKVIVNGVAATVSGNTWTATNVPVSPMGTAGFNVQVKDSSNNPLVNQSLYQPQPPTMAMAAYEQTYQSVDWSYLSSCLNNGPMLTTSAKTYWANGNGLNYGEGQGWVGECGFPVSDNQINNNLSGYTNDLPVAWVEGDVHEGNDYRMIMLHTKTTLALQPAGQEPPGAARTYLVLVSALEYGSVYNVSYYLWNQKFTDGFHAFLSGLTNTAMPPEQLKVNGQTLVNSGITNADGSMWGLVTVSAPSGTSLPLAPSATLSHSNTAPVFQMKAFQLVSKCVATLPSDRARTNLGVGEEVNLYFNPPLFTNYTSVTWSTTAGSLLFTNGTSTLFTAPSNAANVTITATVGNAPVNFYFKVFEPSGVVMVTNGLRHTVDRPNIGIHTLIYLKPDSVNFGRVWVQEEQAYAVATGVYAPFNGLPHETGPTPFPFTSTVVPGLGTSAGLAEDNVYSGDPLTASPFIPGTEVFTIPWDFQVGGTNGTWKTNFTTLTHSCSLGTGGVLTASKGGASWSCNITNASVSY